MSLDDLARYIVTGTGSYVDELLRSGMPEEEARKNAANGIESSFPGGVPANGNEMFDVLDGDHVIGLLWLGPLAPDTWYVMDIEIHRSFRGRGYGRATMLLAETVARERGASYLGLNVFGHNPTARHLYESLGYETQSIRMRKPI